MLNTSSVEPKPKNKTELPIWLLTTIFITLIVGVIAGLLLRNMFSSHQVSLSGPGLISFVFTVALGAASIILAIITVILSRQAEDALIRRSDEGIRLQSDVFVKTNEVLSKIQASTGVTEKRIEDIISGRTNIIAQEVFEKSFTGKRDLSEQTIEKLKNDLAESLKSELLPLITTDPRITLKRLEDMERKQQKRQKITNEWKEFRAAVVDTAQKAPGIQLISESEGNFVAEAPDKFWDAIFDISGRKVGFDIHTVSQYTEIYGSYHNVFQTFEGRMNFYSTISARAIQEELVAVALVFNENISEDKNFKQLMLLFEKMSSLFKTVLITGTPEQIVQALQKQDWTNSDAMPKKTLKTNQKLTPIASSEAPKG